MIPPLYHDPKKQDSQDWARLLGVLAAQKVPPEHAEKIIEMAGQPDASTGSRTQTEL